MKQQFKNHTYQGQLSIDGGENSVIVDGERLPIYLSIVNHSPTGFAWGYNGSGPAQLAAAIMITEFGTDLRDHPVHYQHFKEQIVSRFGDGFTITSEQIRRWIDNQKITTKPKGQERRRPASELERKLFAIGGMMGNEMSKLQIRPDLVDAWNSAYGELLATRHAQRRTL